MLLEKILELFVIVCACVCLCCDEAGALMMSLMRTDIDFAFVITMMW